MRIWSKARRSVLMVCTANICRSPLAHGLLEHLLLQSDMHKLVRVDSAGTHVAKARYRPDPRSQAVALSHGFDVSRQRARQLREKDFERFDDILVMDEGNFQAIEQTFPDVDLSRVKRVLSYTGNQPTADVPDPYYGSPDGFEQVYALLSPAIEAYLGELQVLLSKEESGDA